MVGRVFLFVLILFTSAYTGKTFSLVICLHLVRPIKNELIGVISASVDKGEIV